jgi:hypothetical protein
LLIWRVWQRRFSRHPPLLLLQGALLQHLQGWYRLPLLLTQP